MDQWMKPTARQRRAAGIVAVFDDASAPLGPPRRVSEIVMQSRQLEAARHAAVRRAALLEVELVHRSDELERLRDELRTCHEGLADLRAQLKRARLRIGRYAAALKLLLGKIARDIAPST